MPAYGSGLYGSGVYPGQALLRVWLSTDDASDTSPSWVEKTDDVRSFSWSRGRDSELGDVDAGTLSLTLDNRGRDYDPTFVSSVRPLNRWRVEAVLPSGTVEPQILAYAESYEQQWSGVGEAVTVMAGKDEMKVLALDRLPTTDPPRDSYDDVVLYDGAVGVYDFIDPNPLEATGGGRALDGVNGYSWSVAQGAIVGEYPSGYGIATATIYYILDVETGEPWDAGGLSEFAFEGWVRPAVSLPASDEWIIYGPWTNLSTWSYRLSLLTTGAFKLEVKNGSGTNHTVTSSTTATVGNWYHVVGTIVGSTLYLYVNSAVNSTAWTGTIDVLDESGQPVWFGNGGTDISTARREFDKFAFYRTGLSSSRVTAHYNAGVNRGYLTQDPGARVNAVLDDSTSIAARSIRAGSRGMTPLYSTGQDVLSALRQAESAESVDAVLFIAKDGTITFLDDGHRSVSPWNTVQATFDDDGTDLPYLNVTLDYSESFLKNEWNVTRVGGTTTTSSDPTSISRYFKRSESLTDLPITDAADQTAIAAAMLAKYKDPLTRITTLELDTKILAVAEAALALEIGDRIRVFRTQPTGGRIDQTLFVQKINVEGSNDPPGVWSIRLGVSPL